jgi:hypothetical protein
VVRREGALQPRGAAQGARPYAVNRYAETPEEILPYRLPASANYNQQSGLVGDL